MVINGFYYKKREMSKCSFLSKNRKILHHNKITKSRDAKAIKVDFSSKPSNLVKRPLDCKAFRDKLGTGCSVK